MVSGDEALPAAVIRAARVRGATLVTAESLTAGAVCAALATVPGASSVVRGGIVAYALEVKRDMLGVDPALLEDPGPVSPEVAAAMAAGARRAMNASLAIATTGVAGPEPHGGHAPGTVCVAVVSEEGQWARQFSFAGERADITAAASTAALEFAHGILESPARMAAWKLGTQLR